MKIHGTAKGGALSTKDFGVAFGSAAALPDPDFEDCFTANNWTEADDNYITVNTTDERIDYDIQREASNDKAYRSLGYTADNGAWVWRFPDEMLTQSPGTSSAPHLYVNISSSTGGSESNQDYIGFMYNIPANYQSNFGDNRTLRQSNGTAFTKLVIDTVYYFEIIRTSTTNFTVEVFENSNFTSTFTSTDDDIDSTIQSLQYLSVTNLALSGGVAEDSTGRIPACMKHWDGVTSL